MTLSELREKPHLSAASINDYTDCGLLYKLSRIDKLKHEFQSDSLEFGSVIHMTLGEFYQQKMAGNIMELKDIHNTFERYWTVMGTNRVDIQYSEGKSFEKLLNEGKELLTVYYENRPKDNFQTLALEEPFEFYVEGCDVPIIGAMDLVECDSSDTIIITDFKTAGRTYSTDEIDRNMQLTIYQMAAKANGYQDREIILKFDCLIKTKTPKFEQYYTIRDSISERRAARKIAEVFRGISLGVFIPSDNPLNWRCKNCAYKAACDEWFLREAV
jgi:putative RecB family exonuclease